MSRQDYDAKFPTQVDGTVEQQNQSTDTDNGQGEGDN